MAAVGAASESELQPAAAAAALEPAPTPAAAAAAADARPLATLDPRLLMAARCGDSKALKYLLQLNDDDSNNDQQSTTTTTSVAATPSISTPHVRVEVDPAAAAPAGSFPAAVLALDEDGVTMEGDSLLHVVAACGDTQDYLDCAKVIIRNKEKKGGAGAKRRALEARNNKGDTPLHCAAGAGNAEMIGCLIGLIPSTNDDEAAGAAAKKALVRTQNECGETALHQAVRAARNKKACIDQLMAVDPELACISVPHHEEDAGASPLYLAISLGELEIAEHLHYRCGMIRSNKLSYSGPHGRNVLHAAVHRGQALREILGRFPDVSRRDAYEGSGSSVSLVVSQVTSQRDKKQKGSTPLHLAASLPDSQYAELLVWANKSTAYQADDEGSYPIHVAAASNSLAVVKMVLKECPECATLRDGQGRTFLHVAAEEECHAVVEYVCGEMPPQLSCMILNAQDSNGDTALHGAVRAGNLPVFNCLLRNPQVRLDVPNKDGMTPLDLSRTMIPDGFQYELNPRSIVCSSLYAAEAFPSQFSNIKRSLRRIFVCGSFIPYTHRHHGDMPSAFSFREFSKPRSKAPRKQQAGANSAEESKKYTEATQVMSVVTALIATVTFASAFTLPGGYRADGWPALAGSYAFDAFILADTLAFICSISATCTLVYAGLPAMDISLRHGYINVSAFLLQSAARSLVAAFGLGLYLVVHNTAGAIAACAIVFTSSLYGHMEVGRIIRMATTVHARTGIPLRIAVDFLIYIFFQVLVHFWSYVIIFGLPAIRNRVH